MFQEEEEERERERERERDVVKDGAVVFISSASTSLLLFLFPGVRT
jgi:hypothetical protein